MVCYVAAVDYVRSKGKETKPVPFTFWKDGHSLKRVLREGGEKELDASIFSSVSDAFSQELYKSKLDGALTNVIYGVASLPMIEVLKLDDPLSSFQPRPFDDSMILEDLKYQSGV